MVLSNTSQYVPSPLHLFTITVPVHRYAVGKGLRLCRACLILQPGMPESLGFPPKMASIAPPKAAQQAARDTFAHSATAEPSTLYCSSTTPPPPRTQFYTVFHKSFQTCDYDGGAHLEEPREEPRMHVVNASSTAQAVVNLGQRRDVGW